MRKLLVRVLACFFILANSGIALSQDKVIERVVTPDSIPGWGAPLTGDISDVEYRIVAGDKIEIFVWKNPDLSKNVSVRGDGKISCPLIGTIKAAGLTIEELREELESEFSKYSRSNTEYRIAPRDVINITVWKNAELSRTETVRPDGRISYPLIGTIKATGLTLDEFRETLIERLSPYTRPEAESRIAPGDRIEIYVWKNPDLTRTIVVRKDGKIGYPLIGSIKAAGLSIEKFQDNLEKELSQYIKFPNITVSIVEAGEEEVLELKDVTVSVSTLSDDMINSKLDVTVTITDYSGNKILIFGEVNSEGVYLYNGTITLLEAIAMAGGINTNGKRESVIVVSDNLTEKPTVRRINLLRIIRKGTSSKDIILKPNDVIYVPRTFIAEWNKLLTDIQPTLDKGMAWFDWRDTMRAQIHHWYR